MAVHAKNTTFAEEQKAKIMESVAATSVIAENQPAPSSESSSFTQTVTPSQETGKKKTKDVLIGVHVTEDERTELRQLFCANGFSLATAYRAAMSYLRQDIELGKAYITNNGEIRRKYFSYQPLIKI